MKAFALANDADLVGITPLRPEYVYEGYEIPHPWLVIIGVAMDYENLASAPATIDDPRADWVDLKEMGVEDRAAMHARICQLLDRVDLETDVYHLGLRGSVDAKRRPDIAEADRKSTRLNSSHT